MPTITRTYPILCPSCKGKGFVPDYMPVTTSITIVCPACNGNKTVIATETFESDGVMIEINPVKSSNP